MAEEIDVMEMCSYGQLSEVQMLRDLDIDLGSGQGHVNRHCTCRSTCVLNHVTVVPCITEIRQFEFRQLWKLRDLDLSIRSRSHWCTYVVEVYPHTKLDGNRKNFLWTYERTDTPEFQSTRSSPLACTASLIVGSSKAL